MTPIGAKKKTETKTKVKKKGKGGRAMKKPEQIFFRLCATIFLACGF
jgi:hypothetical protein